jgi:uncharacterized repeat protein (TIGR03806 family)
MMKRRLGALPRLLSSALAVAGVLAVGSDAAAQNPPLGFNQRGTPVITFPLEGPGAATGTPTLVAAFPQLGAFNEPVKLIPVPGSNLVVVIEKAGRLQIFENRPDVTTKSVFLDISARVQQRRGNEQGLLGCAFDPDYVRNGFFYCFYTRLQSGDTVGDTVISRFSRSANNPRLATATSEVRLITIVDNESNHNGGDMQFSPNDGFLYIVTGDGGGANDGFPNGSHGPNGNSQPLDRLAGKMLRIDPETDADGGYQIPPGNPFGAQKCPAGMATNGQPCGEVFHSGLRHPWRFSFDSMTGDGWIGDVGQRAQEEVNFFAAGEAGINFGWPCREGTVAGPRQVTGCANNTRLRGPVTTFPTPPNPSVIGGFVYRGSLMPALFGRYFYAGYNPGTVMTTDRTGNTRQLLNARDNGLIYAFGEDAQRELYVAFGNGSLQKFALSGGTPGAQLPANLSATGLFANTSDSLLRGAAGVNPYDVRAKLFSDNLDKQRHLAVPAGQNITFTATGRWNFPRGSVIAKTFLLGEQRIETRVLVRGMDRWRGYTYQWNAAQTDATLVADAGATIRLSNGQLYDLPSRNDCVRCHNDASNGGSQIIGLQTRQVNFDYAYPTGVTANQLRTLNTVNYFGTNVGLPTAFQTFPDYADPTTGTLAQRAKAYLDQNCGYCHRTGGGTPTAIELEFDRPLTTLVNRTPSSGPVAGAQLVIDPGNKENSVLWQRMRSVVTSTTNPGPAMPPLAHRQLDTVGIQLIGDWIDAMPAAANAD